MSLDLGVLDDVRKELESAQDVSARPVLAAVRTLSSDEFGALGILCLCDGQASFDQVWHIEYIINGKKDWTRERLERMRDYLTGRGVIKISDEKIAFAGDDFDKIYVKYLSRQKKHRVSIGGVEPTFFLALALSRGLSRAADIPAFRGWGPEPEDIDQAIAKLLSSQEDVDAFAESGPAAHDIYMLMMRFRLEQEAPFYFLRVKLPWDNVQFPIFSDTSWGDQSLSKMQEYLEGLRPRIVEIGGEVDFQARSITVLPIDTLVAKVKSTKNERARNYIAQSHIDEMHLLYIDKKDSMNAKFHAELAIEYNLDMSANDCNNVGYIFMANKELTKSEDFFRKSISTWPKDTLSLLPHYNLGILLAMMDRFAEAIEQLEWCIETGKDMPKRERSAACLFVPCLAGENVTYQEVWKDLDIWKCARDAYKALSGKTGALKASVT